jgi:putative endonuclease
VPASRDGASGVGHRHRSRPSLPYWTYILASRPRGTLYVGVTNDLGRRLQEHRDGRGSAFVRRYRVHALVWAEASDAPADAIAREKQIKAWRRAWKIELVERANPDWRDLAGEAG